MYLLSKKYAQGNKQLLMNNEFSYAIMHKSRLRNKFLKDITEENKRNYAKQRNLCVSFLRKSKSQYYGNIDEKKVTDNNFFLENGETFSL